MSINPTNGQDILLSKVQYIDYKGNMSDLFTDDSNLLSLSRQVVSISLAFEQNQIKFFRKCVHLEVEADNEARKGTFHFAHGQCQHDRQEGQCQGGGLEIKLYSFSFSR